MAEKVNIPWFKIFTLGASLVAGLTKAAGNDGKISVEEALAIFVDLCSQAGLVFENTLAAEILKALGLIGKAFADKRITVAEVITIADQLCTDQGIALDKTGFTLPV